MSTKQKEVISMTDMTYGNPYKLILLFSLPLLVGNIFQQLYNMVDSIVVGNFVGEKALAAVGTGFPIIFLMSYRYGFSVLRGKRFQTGERYGQYNLYRDDYWRNPVVPAGDFPQ